MLATIYGMGETAPPEQNFLFAPEPKRPVLLKESLGQYFAPPEVARFMCAMFLANSTPLHLLDPGAGEGILSQIFCERFKGLKKVFSMECDESLVPALAQVHAHLPLVHEVYKVNFIEYAVKMLKEGKRPFSHAVMNPPYKKRSASSSERTGLRSVGIQTVNFYSAFVALALCLLAPMGELVAIIPRSFCNGPY